MRENAMLDNLSPAQPARTSPTAMSTSHPHAPRSSPSAGTIARTGQRTFDNIEELETFCDRLYALGRVPVLRASGAIVRVHW